MKKFKENYLEFEETIKFLKTLTKDFFIIYAHVNKSTGKIYFGQTKKIPSERWRNLGRGYLGKDSKGKYTQPKFANAINKYGWDDFNHYILSIFYIPEDADNEEIRLIKKYNTTKYGLNCFKGGMKIHSHTEMTKKKISKSNMGKKMSAEAIENYKKAMTGRKLSEEHKQKLREISKKNSEKLMENPEHLEKLLKNLSKVKNRAHYGKDNGFYGKHVSEENKEKYMYRSVRCKETGEIFKSINDAAAKYNIKRTGITACCSGKYHTSGGYSWEYIREPSVIKNFKKNK